jgi:Tetratricopeptide repeat
MLRKGRHKPIISHEVLRMKKAIIVFLVVCFISIVAGTSYWYTSNSEPTEESEEVVLSNNPDEDYDKALSLINNGKPLKAIQIIKKYRGAIEKGTDNGNRWLDLFVKASVEIPDIRQLMILYQYRPEIFNTNEEASMMVAEAYLITGKMEEFHKIRDTWKGRETKTNDWLNIDADYFILDGKRDQAIELLSKQSFEGKDDIDRLLRLSLLNINDNPKKSWDYLVEANQKDPSNATILSYRARLLEATGQVALALSEYIAASAADPDNLALRDQLGEFFIRHKRYHQAVQVYEESLKSLEPIDSILLKAIFLGKVIEPFDVEITSDDIPDGKINKLINFINNLKQYQFWNEETFSEIPNHQKYLDTQQVTWWLRLLSAIQNNNLTEAEELLQYNRFQDIAWSPEVSLALKRILNFQLNNTLSLENSPFTITSLEKKSGEESNQWKVGYFSQLNNLAEEQQINPDFEMPEDIHNLLSSPIAFSSALLAIGWDEAALSMQSTKIIPENFPEWVAYGFTQAFRKNKGDMQALEFATLQHQTPPIELLTGEIMLSQNNRDAAINQFERLISDDEKVGVRAAWLLSLVYLNDGDYVKAKEIINQNEKFSQSALGIEALARVALLEEDFPLADKLYKSIEEQSAEAKSYLARQAYQEKNWDRARVLTIELLKEYPNSMVLRQNLLRIMEAQKDTPIENNAAGETPLP